MNALHQMVTKLMKNDKANEKMSICIAFET